MLALEKIDLKIKKFITFINKKLIYFISDDLKYIFF